MTTYSCDHCGRVLNVAARCGAGNGKWLFVAYEPTALAEPNALCSLECLYEWATGELEAKGKKLKVVVA
jgi:hypothetical protein